MVRKLSGLIRHRKQQSEFRMVHYNMKTITQNGYEFPEKMKHHILFQSDIWADIYVVFIGKTLVYYKYTLIQHNFEVSCIIIM